MRNPTTIQVTGQEKEQAVFTMDQWRPVKQSFPFSPSAFLHCCQDWKRQTFGEVTEEEGSSLGQQPPRHLPFLGNLYDCLKNHNDKHTHTHQLLLSPLNLCTLPPCSLLISRAIIMSFNTINKVKTETFRFS